MAASFVIEKILDIDVTVTTSLSAASRLNEILTRWNLCINVTFSIIYWLIPRYRCYISRCISVCQFGERDFNLPNVAISMNNASRHVDRFFYRRWKSRGDSFTRNTMEPRCVSKSIVVGQFANRKSKIHTTSTKFVHCANNELIKCRHYLPEVSLNDHGGWFLGAQLVGRCLPPRTCAYVCHFPPALLQNNDQLFPVTWFLERLEQFKQRRNETRRNETKSLRIDGMLDIENVRAWSGMTFFYQKRINQVFCMNDNHSDQTVCTKGQLHASRIPIDQWQLHNLMSRAPCRPELQRFRKLYILIIWRNV